MTRFAPPSPARGAARPFAVLLAGVWLAGNCVWARPAYVAGEVLVKFKPGAGQQVAKANVRLAGAEVRKTLAGGAWQLIGLPAGMGVPAAVDYYRRQPGVLYAEPNYLAQRRGVPDDPKWAKLWGLAKIGAPQAWDQTPGSTNVVVGVVDSGVDYLHPDLAPNLWHNPGEIPANGIDDDYNGYVDDVYGIDVVNGDGDPMDDDGHGTHTAGTIGAVGNNGLGVVGVNWSVRLLALKIFTADYYASYAQIIETYDYAVALRQRGINLRVLNNSWGGVYPSRALFEAVSKASAAGILIVCSAGNDRQNNDVEPSYPDGYDCEGVISVAASTTADEPAYFSNRYYTVQRAAFLPGAFASLVSNLPATPPENAFVEEAPPEAPHGFYRLRVDCP